MTKQQEQQNGNRGGNNSNQGRRPDFNLRYRTRNEFQKKPRNLDCLTRGYSHSRVSKLDYQRIGLGLDNCETIEHQFVALRKMIELEPHDQRNRYNFTKFLLDCLYRHHNIVYQGILFGSTISGLGFKDSDVDLRLRPLMCIGHESYEPIQFNDRQVELALSDIAYQTCRCCSSSGTFVPSTRVPLAKLDIHMRHRTSILLRTGNGHKAGANGLNYDISMIQSNNLGSFNSIFLRFLCHIEPKFHLLVTMLRYWVTLHELKPAGHFSSYALANMVIFFCQTLEPALLPTVDSMRAKYLEYSAKKGSPTEAITQMEWQCYIDLNKAHYEPSNNKMLLSVLLLKFFEFYLNFPYSTHIITIRPGRALSVSEFPLSIQHHPNFPIKPFMNIQDPFDLQHNLTSGMQGPHFRRIIVTMRHSYESLFDELTNSFIRTKTPKSKQASKDLSDKKTKVSEGRWGLNVVFKKLTNEELK